jgi:signal transduction histidine kinase/ActR/RegA family two-component response regulator
MVTIFPPDATPANDVPPPVQPEPARWRERILNAILLATAALAGIAYVPGVLAALRADLWGLVVVDSVAWGAVLVLALWRGLPYRVRAWGFAGVFYLLALFLLQVTGPGGGGAVWLLSVPVVASVFLGLRGALASLALLLVTLVGFGTLIHLELAGPGPEFPGGAYDGGAWIAMSGGLLFLAMVLSLSVSYLVRGLERSLEEATSSRAAISHAKERLESEMTERKQLESQLLQSQRVEALGTLAGGIAHDFNNLLVPILLESRELRDRAPRDSPEWEGLDAVVRSAVRGRELVSRILAFSKGPEEDRLPVEVEPVVREVGRLLRSTISANVRIQYSLESPGARVLGNPGELHQILMNLATNAYMATRASGGTIILASARDSDTESVVLQVRDSGAGIEPEVQARAFDPFFTTRAPGEGTGLGLSIVHRLVTGLGGTVRLESHPRRGTLAEVCLPESPASHPLPSGEEPSEKEGRTGAVPGTAPSATAATILLVDDEPAVRRATRLVLTRMGYQVEEASTPESALRRLEEAPGAFGLLITDHAMPGMTGLELARHARTLKADLPILLASGYLDAETMERVEDLGLDGTLQKPYDRSLLRAQVESALARHRKESGAAPK